MERTTSSPVFTDVSKGDLKFKGLVDTAFERATLHQADLADLTDSELDQLGTLIQSRKNAAFDKGSKNGVMDFLGSYFEDKLDQILGRPLRYRTEKAKAQKADNKDVVRIASELLSQIASEKERRKKDVDSSLNEFLERIDQGTGVRLNGRAQLRAFDVRDLVNVGTQMQEPTIFNGGIITISRHASFEEQLAFVLEHLQKAKLFKLQSE